MNLNYSIDNNTVIGASQMPTPTPETFLFLTATAWTALGVFLSGLGLFIGFGIPVIQSRIKRRNYIYLIGMEIQSNIQRLERIKIFFDDEETYKTNKLDLLDIIIDNYKLLSVHVWEEHRQEIAVMARNKYGYYEDIYTFFYVLKERIETLKKITDISDKEIESEHDQFDYIMGYLLKSKEYKLLQERRKK